MNRAIALVLVWTARLAAGVEEPVAMRDEALAEAIAEEEERRLQMMNVVPSPSPVYVTEAPSAL